MKAKTDNTARANATATGAPITTGADAAMSTPVPHIMNHNGNRSGKDWVIGDLHGVDAVCEVINKLRPEDRLFFVGDLFDRGASNYKLYQTIRHAQANGRNIYFTQGNHEDYFIKAAPIIQRIKAMNPQELEKFLRDSNIAGSPNQDDIFKLAILLLPHDGGAWIFGDNAPLIEGACTKEMFERYGHQAAFDLVRNVNRIPLAVDINEIAAFLAAQPLIIRVAGTDTAPPFIICHASNPLTDAELERRIQTNTLTLSPNEMACILDTREFGVERRNRSPNSVLTYVGHNQVFERNQFSLIRENTNTVNLDTANCLTNSVFMVNHTDSTCLIERPQPNFAFSGAYTRFDSPQVQRHVAYLNSQQARLSNFLESQRDFQISQENNKQIPIAPSSIPNATQADRSDSDESMGHRPY